MNGFKSGYILVTLCAVLTLSGCSNIPIRDGELVVGTNTTATIDDVGIAKIRNQF